MRSPVISARGQKDDYRRGERIGGGVYGQIYDGIDENTHEKVAIKIEKEVPGVDPNCTNLCVEAKIYKMIGGSIGFCELKFFDPHGSEKMLVMDRLGHSLASLLSAAHGRLSLKSVLMLGDGMISRLQFVHSKGIVHRDIKHHNFVMGEEGKRKGIVHLIDFGLSAKYRGLYDKKHLPFSNEAEFVGTISFASVNVLKGIRYSRRDDMESLAYLLVYLLKGELPWDAIDDPDDNAMRAAVLEMKEQVTPTALCEGIPTEFANFLASVKRLKYNARPNYEEYRTMFRNLFIAEGFAFDDMFDWDKVPASHASGLQLRSATGRGSHEQLSPIARGPRIVVPRLLKIHSV